MRFLPASFLRAYVFLTQHKLLLRTKIHRASHHVARELCFSRFSIVRAGWSLAGCTFLCCFFTTGFDLVNQEFSFLFASLSDCSLSASEIYSQDTLLKSHFRLQDSPRMFDISRDNNANKIYSYTMRYIANYLSC